MSFDDDNYFPEFPVILGQGSLHDLRDATDGPRSRLWGLKSTSKAACTAYDPRPPKEGERKVGFFARRPR